MSSDVDEEFDPLPRPPTGAIRGSLCGQGILRIEDLVKAGMLSQVAIVHRRCFQTLTKAGPQAPERGSKSQKCRG